MNNKKIDTLSTEDIKKINLQYAQHKNDCDMIEKFGIVVMLDILGWKNLITVDNVKEYADILNSLRTKILDILLRVTDDSEDFNVDISIFADTIVILINNDGPFNELNIFNIISSFLTDSLKKGIAFRGAISRGRYYTNLSKNIFIGEAYYEAAQYCESTNWAGVIITPLLRKDLLQNNSIENLKEINIVKYDEIPFKQDFKKDLDLVLVPYREHWIDCERGSSVYTDFKSLYKKIMENKDCQNSTNGKYNNTIKFIEYLEKEFWN